MAEFDRDSIVGIGDAGRLDVGSPPEKPAPASAGIGASRDTFN